MNYSLIFHPEAEKEYNEAFAWYEEKKKGLGTRFETMVEKRLNSIVTNPKTYGFSKGTFRDALVDIFPYSIVYKISKSRKEIYTVPFIIPAEILERNIENKGCCLFKISHYNGKFESCYLFVSFTIIRNR